MLEGEELDMKRIRKLCHAGIPDYPGMRAMYWKVTLHHVSCMIILFRPLPPTSICPMSSFFLSLSLSPSLSLPLSLCVLVCGRGCGVLGAGMRTCIECANVQFCRRQHRDRS